jgi:hypothetical protein
MAPLSHTIARHFLNIAVSLHVVMSEVRKQVGGLVGVLQLQPDG